MIMKTLDNHPGAGTTLAGAPCHKPNHPRSSQPLVGKFNRGDPYCEDFSFAFFCSFVKIFAIQGKVRERTAEAVGLIWDMLPVTEKTKDEIDFSKVPEGVRYNLKWTRYRKFLNMNLFIKIGLF